MNRTPLEPFVNGQVLTAKDLNRLVNAITEIEIVEDSENPATLKAAAVGLAASAVAMTIVATHSAAMAFDRDAISLALRTPAMPKEGSMASDVTIITDPQTGISFQVAMYPQYHRVKYEIGLAWGQCVVAPRHLVRLLH